MTITDLIRLASNRLSTLNSQRSNAVAQGDPVALANIDTLIAETQSTLDKLNTLE
jgi:hypothetical protein